MDSDVVIKVEGLHKKFCRNLRRSMFYGSLDVARDMFGISRDRGKLRKDEFFALENINFELKKGEALGIIGQNGSGKTTLLRIINGIFPPDKGKVQVRGRMGALIAVGAGFHPHMTGRENIFLNGTILGMSKKEINEKFQEIIDFADIGEFIDAPVSTYSSGMTVRLGFSIAIHSNPEILLADEVLAVGDLSFALKCYREIAKYRDNGGSIILVSHGMQLIRNVCNQILWIDKGKKKYHGDTASGCDLYESFMMQKDVEENDFSGSKINNDENVHISGIEFIDVNDKTTKCLSTNDFLRVRIHYSTKRVVRKPIFTFSIVNPENIALIANYSVFDLPIFPDDIFGDGYVDFIIESLALKPGSYNCTVTFAEVRLENVLDWHEKSYPLVIKSNGIVTNGLIQAVTKWNFNLFKNNRDEKEQDKKVRT